MEVHCKNEYREKNPNNRTVLQFHKYELCITIAFDETSSLPRKNKSRKHKYICYDLAWVAILAFKLQQKIVQPERSRLNPFQINDFLHFELFHKGPQNDRRVLLVNISNQWKNAKLK